MKRIEAREKGKRKKKATTTEEIITNGETEEIETTTTIERSESIARQGRVRPLSARNILIPIMLGVIAT